MFLIFNGDSFFALRFFFRTEFMPKRIVSNSDFVHLHCHSEYSSFDGLNKISQFPKYAKELGFKALALTDHGNIGGAIKFIQECNNCGITPICGCEFYLSKDRHINFTEKKDGQKTIKGQVDGRKGNRHLVLLAKDWEGWQNLCSLSQASWVEGMYVDPRIDFELLHKHKKGLLCGSACLSSVVNANLLHDRYNEARKAASLLKDIFEDNFYLEVMYHGIDAEAAIIPDIIKLGTDLNIPICATNDAHYLKQEHGSSHEILMSMSTSRCLHDPKRLHFPHHEFYLKSVPEMAKIFGSHPEFLTNTVMIAEKVDGKDIINNMTSGMRLPRYSTPKDFATPYDYLEHLAWKGMKDCGWINSQPHVDRLKTELADVKVAWENNKYDFATYFLIVRDYIQEAKDRNILTGCGRGSGYSSVLLRVLGISYGPDPLKYDLIWERFLGFDSRFVEAKDFGLDKESLEEKLVIESEEERDVVEDPGGVDRY